MHVAVGCMCICICVCTAESTAGLDAGYKGFVFVVCHIIWSVSNQQCAELGRDSYLMVAHVC